MSDFTKDFKVPSFGGGAGLRHEHFQEIIENKPPFKWFEVITENFLGYGGYVKESFEEIRKHYPIIPHGVTISLGSTDPLNKKYLADLKDFCDLVKAPWTSDHLCFTMVDHTNLNELVPIPFTEESAKNVIERIAIIQDVVERPFLFENVTRYLTVSDREMTEAQFISKIAEEANCGILLDITNVILNSRFHGYDAYDFVKSLPHHRIAQMHLAGWEVGQDGKIIDSHDAPVPEEVWELYRYALTFTGHTSAVVERDEKLGSVSELLAEAQQADRIMHEVLTKKVA